MSESELFGSKMQEALGVTIKREQQLARMFGEPRLLTVHGHNRDEACSENCKALEITETGEVIDHDDSDDLSG